MTLPYFPPAAGRAFAAPTLRPTSRFLAEYRRSVDALTGQTATFTRASTATMTDSAGATVTIGYARPRREARTFAGTAELGLRVSTEDLTYAWDVLPEQGTWLIEGINLGTAQTNGAGLLYLGRDDATGARLSVRGTGSTIAVDLTNASGDVSTATLGTSVANPAAVRLVVQLDDDGTNQRVRIGGEVAGVDAGFSSWGTARARAAAWGTGTKLRVNRVGSAGTQGSAWLRAIAYRPGLLTVADLSGVL